MIDRSSKLEAQILRVPYFTDRVPAGVVLRNVSPVITQSETLFLFTVSRMPDHSLLAGAATFMSAVGQWPLTKDCLRH